MTRFSRRAIWGEIACRETGMFGENVVFYPEVSSTNDVAKQLAESHAPEGTVVITEYQTAGRGRRGRSWDAAPGSSLMLSVLFRPDMPPEEATRLVMMVGLAAAEACEALADVELEVKWPNDLLINGKKVAGILPESVTDGGKLAWVVVGIGINVDQPFAQDSSAAATATYLRAESDMDIQRVTLLGILLERMNNWYNALTSEELADAWRNRCITLGQMVTIKRGDDTLCGIADNLDRVGALWIRKKDGQRHRVLVGDV